jgi:hypothetical protein
MIPGNGRSAIAEGIAKSRLFQHVTATDAAVGVSEAMSVATAPLHLTNCLKFEHDDITHSSFGSTCVDCILDKGLVDALACADDAAIILGIAASEYARLLRLDGILVIISGRPMISCLLPFQDWALLQEVGFKAASGASCWMFVLSPRRL